MHRNLACLFRQAEVQSRSVKCVKIGYPTVNKCRWWPTRSRGECGQPQRAVLGLHTTDDIQQSPRRRVGTDGILSRYAPHTTFTVQSRCMASSAGFIHQVLQQVKKDLAANPQLQKDLRALENLRSKTGAVKGDSRKVAGKFEDTKRRASGFWGEVVGFTGSVKERASAAASSADLFLKRYPVIEKVKVSSSVAVRAVVDRCLGLSQKVADVMRSDDEEKAKARNEKWRKQREANRAAHKTDSAPAEESEGAQDAAPDEGPTIKEEFGLVVTQETAWDRFGAGLRDMPFLKDFWGSESPMLGKIFGETEQGAALRDMKTLDPSFRLPEFIDLFEHVIAPHMLKCYLEGDVEMLRTHCGEAAFAAIEQTIRERQTLKLTLDPTVLILRNVELQGVTRMEDGPPWFVFTFSAQQINCMRDGNSKVVMGAVDDIREVVYSMALTKHVETDTEGLQYPWMVKEMAIIGNSPTW